MGARHYPALLVRWLLRDRFDSAEDAAAITAPTLLLAAADDDIIPPARAEALALVRSGPALRHFRC